MARPVRSDYDNPGQFGQALREYEAANPTTPQTLDPGLVYEARGFYGDETYINELVGGTGQGAGTLEERQNALNTLIKQGKDRNLTERGSVDAFPGAPIVSNNTGGGDDGGEEEFLPAAGAKAILLSVLASYGLESLYEYAYSLYAKNEIDANDGASLVFALKEQEA